MELQMKFGEQDIGAIQYDLKSRDEIPKLLMGLQYIYTEPAIRAEVFDILKGIIPEGINTNNGRPGMELWKMLILGTLRLNCNWDYDKVKEIADNHKKVRQMMGHSDSDTESTYPLQTIKDNISLFTPEILDRINQIVVKAGHSIVKKKDEALRGKCDSFVVKTDVHFPTDINLLYDAVRKMISLISILCGRIGNTGWRKGCFNIGTLRKKFNYIRKLKHSTSKEEKKKTEHEKHMKKAHAEYIDSARGFVEKAERTIETLRQSEQVGEHEIGKIEEYIGHAKRQTDQIRRRVIMGEVIPHSEKVFSIFEEHTEWISKGKAGVPQELGLRVCIVEDQFRFILHHRVMEKETDDRVAVLMAKETKARFEDFGSCSYDKGFYSRDNTEEAGKILDAVILPKKGKLSAEDKERENTEEFLRLRKAHPGIESAINALENHSLDRCPDHGITGFKRYVSLAVLGRNLQVLGNIIQQQRITSLKRKEKYRITRDRNRELQKTAA